LFGCVIQLAGMY